MSDDANTILSAFYLLYSIYAFILSSLICLLLINRRKGIQTGVSLLLFLMFLTGAGCYFIAAFCSTIALISARNLDQSFPHVCDALGYIYLFFEFSKNFIMFLLCFFIYMQVCREINMLTYKCWIFPSIFIVSAFLSSFPFMINSNDDAFRDYYNLECWMDEEGYGLYIYYIPLLLIFIISTAFLILSYRKFRKEKHRNQKDLIKMFTFPSLMFVSYSMAFIRSLVLKSSGYDLAEIMAIRYINYLMFPVHGIFSSFFFFYLKPSFLHRLKSFLFPKQRPIFRGQEPEYAEVQPEVQPVSEED